MVWTCSQLPGVEKPRNWFHVVLGTNLFGINKNSDSLWNWYICLCAAWYAIRLSHMEPLYISGRPLSWHSRKFYEISNVHFWSKSQHLKFSTKYLFIEHHTNNHVRVAELSERGLFLLTFSFNISIFYFLFMKARNKIVLSIITWQVKQVTSALYSYLSSLTWQAFHYKNEH